MPFSDRTSSGAPVAVSDDMLAVKAPFGYDGLFRGVVYLFKRGTDGKFKETQLLSTPEGSQLSMMSGSSFVFLDEFLLVGAGGAETVYVFKQNGSGIYIRRRPSSPPLTPALPVHLG